MLKEVLASLDQNPYTNTISKKINTAISIGEYDIDYANQILAISKQFNNGVIPLDDFIYFSKDFLIQQMRFEKKGAYAESDFKKIYAEVYSIDSEMKRYLNGLFLSEILWINQYKLLQFYLTKFCKPELARGSICEVPSGTGIFLASFLKQNANWRGVGYDISSYAVEFSKQTALAFGVEPEISVQDVFKLEGKHDLVVCGELAEHIEHPEELMEKLNELLNDKKEARVFFTTAIACANVDHIFLFNNVQEVRDLVSLFFEIEEELVLSVFDVERRSGKTPLNYAAVLRRKK